MLALGYVTKYSGTDATLGLALAKTGSLYPFFGTLLGWHGMAPAVADGSNPRLLGGIAAGCIAALFGGLLIGKIKDRVSAVGSAR